MTNTSCELQSTHSKVLHSQLQLQTKRQSAEGSNPDVTRAPITTAFILKHLLSTPRMLDCNKAALYVAIIVSFMIHLQFLNLALTLITGFLFGAEKTKQAEKSPA